MSTGHSCRGKHEGCRHEHCKGRPRGANRTSDHAREQAAGDLLSTSHSHQPRELNRTQQPLMVCLSSRRQQPRKGRQCMHWHCPSRASRQLRADAAPSRGADEDWLYHQWVGPPQLADIEGTAASHSGNNTAAAAPRHRNTGQSSSVGWVKEAAGRPSLFGSLGPALAV